MPKVVISFDPDSGDYWVEAVAKDFEPDPEYQAVMDMKSSHFRNILRNAKRYENDLNTLHEFFVRAQMSGRQFRER